MHGGIDDSAEWLLTARSFKRGARKHTRRKSRQTLGNNDKLSATLTADTVEYLSTTPMITETFESEWSFCSVANCLQGVRLRNGRVVQYKLARIAKQFTVACIRKAKC